MYKVLILAFVAASLSGCSSLGAKPWERGNLAKASMTFGSDAVVDVTDDHVYFSKEASSGGRSFGAGGCGCN